MQKAKQSIDGDGKQGGLEAQESREEKDDDDATARSADLHRSLVSSRRYRPDDNRSHVSYCRSKRLASAITNTPAQHRDARDRSMALRIRWPSAFSCALAKQSRRCTILLLISSIELVIHKSRPFNCH